MMSPSMAPPASPSIDARPPADLSGNVARRIVQVIDQQIDPTITAHSGHAELVAVEEHRLPTPGRRLSGCGIATVTLSQGIEVAITEAVPEIARVVNVTDHAVSTNPFFDPPRSRAPRPPSCRPGEPGPKEGHQGDRQRRVRRDRADAVLEGSRTKAGEVGEGARAGRASPGRPGVRGSASMGRARRLSVTRPTHDHQLYGACAGCGLH